MRGTWISALGALAAVVAVAGPARAQSGAKTPRECIDGINKCADANDAPGLVKFIAEPASSSLGRMFSATKALSDSMKKVVDALDAKFGEGTAKELGVEATPMDLSDMKIKDVEITETGDDAIAKSKKGADDEEKYYFTKAAGFWLMDPVKEEGAAEKMKSIDKMAAGIKKSAALFEALAADVTSGKATKDDLAARMAAIGKEMEKGGGD